MFRGYRLLVAALAGLILAGAQQPSEQTKAGGGAQQTQAAASPTPTPPPTTEPPYRPYPDYDPDPCYRAQNHDAADLCAQWRAAIAAEKAAQESRRATNWGIGAAFLSFLTLGGLIVTIWQTQGALTEARRGNRIAMKANARSTRQSISSAEETREATETMRAANQINLDAQRPWISVEAEITEFRVRENSLRFCYVVRFTNTGKTVACKVWVASKAYFAGQGFLDRTKNEFQRWRAMDNGEGVSLMPGETVQHEAVNDVNMSELPWVGEGQSKSVSLVVNAAAYYFITENLRPGEARLTERTFVVGQQNVNPMKQLTIPLSRIYSMTADSSVVRRTYPSDTT